MWNIPVSCFFPNHNIYIEHICSPWMLLVSCSTSNSLALSGVLRLLKGSQIAGWIYYCICPLSVWLRIHHNDIVLYFSYNKPHWPTRCFVIFLLDILEERINYDECMLILVIYWKKTGLLCYRVSNHIITYSS
jgi:hypothetical protein